MSFCISDAYQLSVTSWLSINVSLSLSLSLQHACLQRGLFSSVASRSALQGTLDDRTPTRQLPRPHVCALFPSLPTSSPSLCLSPLLSPRLFPGVSGLNPCDLGSKPLAPRHPAPRPLLPCRIAAKLHHLSGCWTGDRCFSRAMSAALGALFHVPAHPFRNGRNMCVCVCVCVCVSVQHHTWQTIARRAPRCVPAKTSRDKTSRVRGGGSCLGVISQSSSCVGS